MRPVKSGAFHVLSPTAIERVIAPYEAKLQALQNDQDAVTRNLKSVGPIGCCSSLTRQPGTHLGHGSAA